MATYSDLVVFEISSDTATNQNVAISAFTAASINDLGDGFYNVSSTNFEEGASLAFTGTTQTVTVNGLTFGTSFRVGADTLVVSSDGGSTTTSLSGWSVSAVDLSGSARGTYLFFVASGETIPQDLQDNPTSYVVQSGGNAGGGSMPYASVMETSELIPPYSGDFIVTGTGGADLIDIDFTDAADGDKVDNNDGNPNNATGNDDSIIAGAENDTILAGDGDDTIEGGDGDDYIEGDGGAAAPTSAGTDFGTVYGFDAKTITQKELANTAIYTGGDSQVNGEDVVSAYTTAFRISGNAQFDLNGQTLMHAGWVSYSDAGSTLDNTSYVRDPSTDTTKLINGESYSIVNNGYYDTSQYNNYSFVAGDGNTYTVNDIRNWAENNGFNTTDTSNIFLQVLVNDADPNDYIAVLSSGGSYSTDEALENFFNDHGGLTSITLNSSASVTQGWSLNKDVDLRLSPATNGSLDNVVPASEKPLIANFAQQGDQTGAYADVDAGLSSVTTTLFEISDPSKTYVDINGTLTAIGYGTVQDGEANPDNGVRVNETLTIDGENYTMIDGEKMFDNFSLQMGDGNSYTYAQYQAWVDANLSTSYDDRLSLYVVQNQADPTKIYVGLGTTATSAGDFCLASFAAAHGGLVSLSNLDLDGYTTSLTLTGDSTGAVAIDGMTLPGSTTTGSGNDSIDGGAGNDTILGNGGDDTIRAGEGDDSVLGGEGADSIFGFEGSDTVDGGDGDDYINTRTSVGTGVPDTEYVHPSDSNYTYPADTDPNNDRDSVLGGAGNDTILTGDDADTIDGGDGADVIDAGFDDDIVSGGLGADSIQGADGADTIDGGDGDDVIYGGVDPLDPTYAEAQNYEIADVDGDTNTTSNSDSLVGGAGNDRIYGQDDSDTLEGGLGNDTLDGGIDNDTLIGGAGDDQLTGGQGDDVFVFENSGNDTITDFGAGITGNPNDGSDQTDNDFVDMNPYYDNLSELRADFEDDGILNQSNSTDLKGRAVDYSNNTAMTGTLTLSGVTKTDLTYDTTNVICFTKGSMIRTIDGLRPIETLEQGDLVWTQDDGYQPVRWIGSRRFGRGHLSQHEKLRPIRIKAGALGQGVPETDLVVSQQHRVLASSSITKRMTSEDEVLVAAKHLLLVNGIDVDMTDQSVTYYHILFDKHQIVEVNGALTESMFTGPEALKSVSMEAREEIFAIFPELSELDHATLPSVRPILSGRKGRKLAQRHKQNRKFLV